MDLTDAANAALRQSFTNAAANVTVGSSSTALLAADASTDRMVRIVPVDGAIYVRVGAAAAVGTGHYCAEGVPELLDVPADNAVNAIRAGSSDVATNVGEPR